MEEDVDMSGLIEWVCPKCGKKIVSLYQRQLEFNIRSHNLKHAE